MKSFKDGFTMVEMMVVVVIIGIISAVGVVVMGANKDRAVSSEAVAMLGSVNHACVVYKMEQSSNPGNIDQLISSGCFKRDNLNGTYFESSDYVDFEIGSLGGGKTGVVSAVVEYTKVSPLKTFTFTWNTDNRNYTMNVK